ncbi:hypothetical protein [Vibrio splendidus]|uniref:hypothetical protein n=1 Tax=Vibrio splendidus TaxID=29497 RepID=UPI0002EC7F98|nr:hypothetical protein [Vibrio splendidus]MDP2591950.1 hypothetical protein [Vibrio splendidus]OEE54528.1 hypothetical protein A146_15735 [Vibrio splendidus FF-500]
MNRFSLLISGCSSVLLLTGCLTDTSRPFELPQLALFKGMYENADNDSYLLFESGQVTYQTTDNSITRTYRVDDDLITIEFNSGSSRTDSRLVMRIQQQGEMLTCNQCPAIQLSNVWTLIEKPLKDSSN